MLLLKLILFLKMLRHLLLLLMELNQRVNWLFLAQKAIYMFQHLGGKLIILK